MINHMLGLILVMQCTMIGFAAWLLASNPQPNPALVGLVVAFIALNVVGMMIIILHKER